MPDAAEDRLDTTLTGLAMYEAFTRGDETALRGLTATTEPDVAVRALLLSMEVMCGMFAAHIGATPERVIDSMRRRIVTTIADGGP